MRDALSGRNFVKDCARRNAHELRQSATGLLICHLGVPSGTLDHVVRHVSGLGRRAVVEYHLGLLLTNEVPQVHAVLSVEFVFQSLMCYNINNKENEAGNMGSPSTIPIAP